MENVAFIEMDDNTKPMDNGQVKAEDDDENKPSNRRSSRKYSVTRKEATMELSELSKHSRYTYGDSTESLIHIAVRQGRSSLLNNEITKAKENDSIDGLDNVGFAALHHTTRYNRLEAIEVLLKNGAKVNLRSREDQLTPLHISSRFGWLEASEILLKKGADPSLQTVNGVTPLHLACRRGNLSIVELLLKQPSVNVDAKDKSLLTPLHLAASQGHEQVVNMLLQKGADVFSVAADRTTPLHVAIMNGHSNCTLNATAMTVLAKAFEMAYTAKECFMSKTQDMEGYTLIHIAAVSNDIEVMKMALDRGVPIDLPNSNNSKTAFHLACKSGSLKMATFLLQRGANLHAKDIQGQTSLHFAVQRGHKAIVEFLIENGAEVDVRDDTNKTPFLLVASCANANVDTVRVLIERGADINANEAFMKNCLHLAIEGGNVEMIQLLLDNERALENLYSPDVEERVPLHYAAVCDNLQILKLILTKQTRLNFQDEDQKTALYLAAVNNRAEHVEVLGRAGSSINGRDDEGQTALHAAACNASKKVCKILLILGADVNGKDSKNRTPLICAATSGCAKTCKALIRRNANVDNTSSDGDTALLSAIRSHNNEVVELLMDNNANVIHRDYCGLGVIETAMKCDDKDSINIICSHERWKEVLNDTSSPQGHRPMQLLIQHFPDAATTVMNNCITRPVNTNPTHEDYTITYNFEFLDPGPDDPDFIKGNRYFGPQTMVEYSRQNLLLHPLTQILLEKKWSSFGSYVYYLSLALYMCFIISFSYFVVVERSNVTFHRNETTQLKVSNIYNATGNNYRLAVVILSFAFFQLLKEVLQIFLQRLQYFKQGENLLEWILYASCFVFLLPYTAPDDMVDSILGSVKDPFYMWITAITSIFLCYVNLVLFLRRFSFFGIYITMFLVVFRSLIKVMIVFMEFIVAFAVVFYILFKEQPAFSSVLHSIYKTMAMTIGELDFTATFVDTIGELSTTGRPLNPFPDVAFFFCGIFVYAMCITLMNLLIGLAIGDIDNIQRSAELKRLAMQVDFVAQIEEKYPRCITRRVYKPVIEIMPNKKTISWRFKKICRIFQGALKDLTLETVATTPEPQAVDMRQMASNLEKNRRQIKELVTAMEAQTSMIKCMADQLSTGLKPKSIIDTIDMAESIDGIDIAEKMRDVTDHNDKTDEW